jgi:CrcB protein
MQNLILVMLGGGIGAGARHLVNLTVPKYAGTDFPWATVTVNIVGALAMGLLVGWLARRSGDANSLRLFLATGILGGFTTFSAFSLDFAVLWERGATAIALAYVGLSVIGSLAAIFAGLWLVRTLG